MQISKSLLGGGTHRGARARGGSGSRRSSRGAWRTRSNAAIAGAVIVLGTLAVAWLVSQVSPAWTTRYLGVLLGPMLLVAALGLARAGALDLVALAIIFGIWAIPKSHREQVERLRPAQGRCRSCRRATWCCRCSPSRGRCSRTTSRTSAERLICAGHALGAVENDRVMDWTDGYDRMQDATVAENLDPLVDNLPAGGHVLDRAPGHEPRGRLGRSLDGARQAPVRPVGRGLAQDPRFEALQQRAPELSPRHANRSARRPLREDRMSHSENLKPQPPRTSRVPSCATSPP